MLLSTRPRRNWQRRLWMTSAGLLSVARGDSPADLVIVKRPASSSTTFYPAEIEETGGRHRRRHDRRTGQGISRGESNRSPSRLSRAGIHRRSRPYRKQPVPAVAVRCGAAATPAFCAAVSDPHEIANVAGPGWRAIHDRRLRPGLPLDTPPTMAPSCVPATTLATTGGPPRCRRSATAFTPEGLVHGLAEGDELSRRPSLAIRSWPARSPRSSSRPTDGHCPGVGGHPAQRVRRRWHRKRSRGASRRTRPRGKSFARGLVRADT